MSRTALLRYYQELGVDEILADAPIDRYAEALAAQQSKAVSPSPLSSATTAPPVPPAPSAQHTPQPVSRPGAVPLASPEGLIANAKKAAEACTTIVELRKAVEDFDGCSLKKTATHTVFSDGNPESELMLIGEAPGAEEDRQGIPFCGPSGQLLDKMLAAIGYNRSSCYITNTLFWRPPGNRKPSPEEIALCQPFVQKHVALMRPKLIVLVGGTAATAMLGETRGITRLRGTVFQYENPYLDAKIPAIPLYHPSYLLRQPAHKRLAWQDLLKVKSLMSGN